MFFLYSAVSSTLDRSNHFTLHPMADLFMPAPTRLLWEALSHASIRANTIHSHFHRSLYCQVLIYTAGWTEASWRERNWQSFETVAKGIGYQFNSILWAFLYLHFICKYINRIMTVVVCKIKQVVSLTAVEM